MPRRRSRLGEALATDLTLYARFVDIWRRGGPGKPETACTPVTLNDIAWELGIGQSKAAITFRYAEEQGYVRRTSPRTEQAAYEPTDKALAAFPEGGGVMPDEIDVEIGEGIRARSMSADEARDDTGWTNIEERQITDSARRRELPPGD